MAEIIKENTTAQENNAKPVAETSVKEGATNYLTGERLIYFLFGILEVLLIFRLVFKLAGAGSSSTFVGFIYGFTGIFITPFEGIFHRGFAPGAETTSVFEPSTLVAIIVYAVLAWGIVKLIRIFSRAQQAS